MRGDIDYSDIGSYLESVAKRIASLEVTAEELEEDIMGQSERIKESGRDFKDEIHRLKNGVKEARKEVSELSKNTKNVIQEFKRVVRQDSLRRLKGKVDEWNPEGMATHEDLHRQLKKLKK